MFSKDHLNKILALNAEHALASPERRKQIEQEIIDMVPKDLAPPTPALSEISSLQDQLKEKINGLAQCATKSDFELFYKELGQIEDKICEYAAKVGTEFKKTDYGTLLSKMLESKFGVQTKNEDK